MASLDVQGNGYPPNCQQFEYVTITSVNSSTGVIGTGESIRYQHRTDYPDFTVGVPCGKARVWKLNTGNWSPGNGASGTFPALVVNWDIDYNIVGPLIVNVPTFAFGFPGLPYQNFTGRRVLTFGWTGPGFSESTAQSVVHSDALMTTSGEPDKLVSYLTYRNCSSSVGTSLFFQSPFDFVLLDNCRFSGVSTGTVKNFRAVNCDIGSLGIGYIDYGLSSNQEFDNCRIYNWSNTGAPLYDGVQGATSIDGTNISYANGVFTILKSGIGFWGNVVPGGYLAFVAPAGFPGDIGVMRILSTTEDSTHVFITTDSPFTSVPVWCSPAKFYYFQIMNVEFHGCTGCDQIRNFSEASAKGFRYFERLRLVTAGLPGGQWFGDLPQAAGNVTKVTVNPINIGGTSGVILTLTFDTYNSASNFAHDSGGMVLNFNVGVAGKRVLNKDSLTCTGGSDSFTLAGSPITVLPSYRVCFQEFST